MRLKELHPHEAKKRYLNEKSTHVAKKTLYNYTTALDIFTDWLADQGINDMRDVDSETVDTFKQHRLQNVKPITARNDLRTVRNFIRECESYQCVPVGLHELIRPPKVKEEDEINETILTRSEADDILNYLGKYEYASTRHVVFLILWKTGMRLSGLRALDVGDFDSRRPALEIRHRPDTGTPLKRKHKSERDVSITDQMAASVSDYIENGRPDVEDDHGRKPLIATKFGRIGRSTIERHVYRVTSPCYYSDHCPVDDVESPSTCEYNSWNESYGCPMSVSPHALRRGYVTAARNAGQPKEATSERVNMSGPILDKHYDHGTHDERMERRKDVLKDI